MGRSLPAVHLFFNTFHGRPIGKIFLSFKIWIVLLVFSNSAGLAQNADPVKLLKIIRDANTRDTTRILAMTELAYTYWTTNADSTVLLANQSIDQAKKIHFAKGIGRGYVVLGIHYSNLGNSTKGLACYDSALIYTGKISDQQGIGRVYNSLGQLYANLGDYQKALRFHFQSLKIKEAQSDSAGLGNSYNNIGNIYYRLGSYEKALDYCFQGLAIRNVIQDKQGIAASQNNIALIYDKLGNTDKALDYFTQALSSFKEVGNLRGVTYSCHDIAHHYLNEKNYDKAYQYLQQGLAAAVMMKSNERIADLDVSLAQYHNAIGKYAEANNYAQTALGLALESGLLEYARMAYLELATAAFKSNRFKEAYQFQQQFSILSDSIQNGKKVEAALQEEFDFREAKSRLEQEKKDLIYENNAERQQWLLYITLGILLGMVIVAYVLYRSSELKRRTSEVLALQRNELAEKNTLIQEQNNLLRDGKIHLEQKIDQRTRALKIANEELINKNQALEQFSFMTAHNLRGPVARLMGLSSLYNFDNLTEPFNVEVMKRVQQSSADLDEVIRDMTAILQVQIGNNASFARINVKETLNTIVHQLRQSITDSHVVITDELPANLFIEGTLPYLQSVFYNVISNSIKYCKDAEAPQIRISAVRNDQQVVVTLTDNGVGFDVAGNRDKLFRPFTRFSSVTDGKGLGLYLIKIQMESMLGRVDIESMPNAGTSVLLTFPLPQADANS